jgi:hypothetical protein
MNRCAAVCLALVLACGRPEPDRSRLEPFEKDGLWGYRDASGTVGIPNRYAAAYPFSGRMAAVAADSGWIYIDREGRTCDVRPFAFDNGPDPFSEGLARCTAGGKIGFVDTSGAVAVAPRFDFAGPFVEGLAAFCEGCSARVEGEVTFHEGGRWGFIDRTGRVALEARFDEAASFENGKARVRAGSRTGYINPEGKWVKDPD